MRKHLKNYFVPHEENDHKPHIFGEISVLFLAILILGTFTLTAYEANLVKNDKSFLAAVLPSVLVALANEDRSEEGVSPLEYSETLEQAAQMKANHMAEHEYFAHTSPEGVTPWHWFREVGYDFKYAGENLAVDFEESEDVNDAWMDSPGHRENILETQFTQIGIATARGMHEGEKAVYVVQLFGTPAETEQTFDEEENVPQVISPQVEPATEVQPAETNTSTPPESPSAESVSGSSAAEEQTPNASNTPTTQTPEDKNMEKGKVKEKSILNEDAKEENKATTASSTPLAQIKGDGSEAGPLSGASVGPTSVPPEEPIVNSAGSTNTSPGTSFFAWLFLHQMFILQLFYLVFGVLIAASLGLMVNREVHHHHMKHATAGASLLVLMMVLTTLTHFYIFPVLSFS